MIDSLATVRYSTRHSPPQGFTETFEPYSYYFGDGGDVTKAGARPPYKRRDTSNDVENGKGGAVDFDVISASSAPSNELHARFGIPSDFKWNATEVKSQKAGRELQTLLDDARLNILGYKQELNRSVGLWGAFSLSFLALGSLPGWFIAINDGLLQFGGPASMFWGTVIVSIFTISMGVSMAEIASSYPTAGGVYYWTYRLAAPKYRLFSAWVVGYFAVLSQWSTIATTAFLASELIQALIVIATNAYVITPAKTAAIYWLLLVINAVLATFPKALNFITRAGVLWYVIGGVGISIAILAAAPELQSASFVFTQVTSGFGWSDNLLGWCFVLSTVQNVFANCGWDGSSHIAEETKGAAKNTPKAIIYACIGTALLSLLSVIAFLFTAVDVEAIVNSELPIALLVYNATRQSDVAVVLIFIIEIVGLWLSMLAVLVANSRMVYALSRDGVLPFSERLQRISRRAKIPVGALWTSTFIMALVILPVFGSQNASLFLVSASSTCSYISYAIPIFCAVVNRERLEPGPFHLGNRLGRIVGSINCVWAFTIIILTLVPLKVPVTAANMNYASVMLCAFGAIIAGLWLVRGRSTFEGPKTRNAIVMKGLSTSGIATTRSAAGTATVTGAQDALQPTTTIRSLGQVQPRDPEDVSPTTEAPRPSTPSSTSLALSNFLSIPAINTGRRGSLPFISPWSTSAPETRKEAMLSPTDYLAQMSKRPISPAESSRASTPVEISKSSTPIELPKSSTPEPPSEDTQDEPRARPLSGISIGSNSSGGEWSIFDDWNARPMSMDRIQRRMSSVSSQGSAIVYPDPASIVAAPLTAPPMIAEEDEPASPGQAPPDHYEEIR